MFFEFHFSLIIVIDVIFTFFSIVFKNSNFKKDILNPFAITNQAAKLQPGKLIIYRAKSNKIIKPEKENIAQVEEK